MQEVPIICNHSNWETDGESLPDGSYHQVPQPVKPWNDSTRLSCRYKLQSAWKCRVFFVEIHFNRIIAFGKDFLLLQPKLLLRPKLDINGTNYIGRKTEIDSKRKESYLLERAVCLDKEWLWRKRAMIGTQAGKKSRLVEIAPKFHSLLWCLATPSYMAVITHINLISGLSINRFVLRCIV